MMDGLHLAAGPAVDMGLNRGSTCKVDSRAPGTAKGWHFILLLFPSNKFIHQSMYVLNKEQKQIIGGAGMRKIQSRYLIANENSVEMAGIKK